MVSDPVLAFSEGLLRTGQDAERYGVNDLLDLERLVI